ncbi:hypothetical protein QC762_306080 [Podospora pseudocomata]|uniref:Rhodopsin domain-containing protein n=1 Tax=Podospora pseudocomata TaxID=2093779 RepID=A0ABR0GJT5_9PEZI|nr:hypothetical protein QC762_306080 [Podospora pseudocomata]
MGGKFEVDDWVMMIVVGLYIGFEAVGCTAAGAAFGVDIWTVDANALGTALKLFYMAETFYLVILALTKISILCFYLRIFPQLHFRTITLVVMTWVGLSGLIFVFCQIFQCAPISFIWEGWRKGEFGPFSCLDINALGYTTAAFSIAQDIVILVMPLPLLIKLNVNVRSKICIIVMFSLGIFALITSCVRLWALYDFGDSVNPTWDYTNALIWTGLEVGVSIIVTSLPAIRVLLGRRGRGGGGGLLGGGGGGGWSRDMASRGTTSSFGNTSTFVASRHTMPPHLKRISSVSRISSIRVGEEDTEKGRGDDVERGRGLEVLDGGKAELEDVMAGGNGGLQEEGLRRPWSDVSVGNSTVVGSESDFEQGVDISDLGWPFMNKAVLAGAGGVGGQRLSHMPSIDEVLTYSGSNWQGIGPRSQGSQGSRLSNNWSYDSEGSGNSMLTFSWEESTTGGWESWDWQRSGSGSGSGSGSVGGVWWRGSMNESGNGSRSGSGSGGYEEEEDSMLGGRSKKRSGSERG